MLEQSWSRSMVNNHLYRLVHHHQPHSATVRPQVRKPPPPSSPPPAVSGAGGLRAADDLAGHDRRTVHGAVAGRPGHWKTPFVRLEMFGTPVILDSE